MSWAPNPVSNHVTKAVGGWVHAEHSPYSFDVIRTAVVRRGEIRDVTGRDRNRGEKRARLGIESLQIAGHRGPHRACSRSPRSSPRRRASEARFPRHWIDLAHLRTHRHPDRVLTDRDTLPPSIPTASLGGRRIDLEHLVDGRVDLHPDPAEPVLRRPCLSTEIDSGLSGPALPGIADGGDVLGVVTAVTH